MPVDPALIPYVREYKRLDKKRREGPLSDRDKRRLKKLRKTLRRHMQQGGPDEDRRTGPRVPAVLEASFEDRGAFRQAWTKDISGGGLMIETTTDMPMGHKTPVSIAIGEGDPIKAACEVVWRREEPGNDGTTQFILGVRFVDLDDDTQERIDDVVYKRMEDEAARLTFLTEDMVSRITEG